MDSWLCRNQLGTGLGYDMRLVGSWMGYLRLCQCPRVGGGRKGENGSDKYEARTMEDQQFNMKRETTWKRCPRVLRGGQQAFPTTGILLLASDQRLENAENMG